MAKRPGPKGLLNCKPDLTFAATLLLGILCRGNRVFEFGSGGSTLWLAGIASWLISIEDDSRWYDAVRKELVARELNADLRLLPTARMPEAIDETSLWDVVFVDCRNQIQRGRAILRARAHVEPGGWIVADDYNFQKVAKSVGKLARSGWYVAVVDGIKLHAERKVPVKTATAFCRRLE